MLPEDAYSLTRGNLLFQRFSGGGWNTFVHYCERRFADEDKPPPSRRQQPLQTALTGENEHERESAGDPMPPDEPMPEFELNSDESSAGPETDDAATHTSRRFRAWGAAQPEESGPSFWHRTSERIKKLFTRTKPAVEMDASADVDADVEASAEEDADAVAVDAPMFGAEPESVESEPAESEPVEPVGSFSATVADGLPIPIIEPPAETPALDDAAFYIPPDEPKEDLKFLRTGEADAIPESEFTGAQLREGPTADMDALADALAQPVEDLPPEPPRKQRASLLKRVFLTPIVFGPRAKNVEVEEEEEIPDTGETEIPAAVDAFAEQPHDEPEVIAATQPMDVASLDEALPMDSPMTEPIDLVDFVPDVELESEPEPPKKPGFFARLFGRKSAEAPTPIEPDVDAEADVGVEADAVGQLDAVDEGFEAARSEFAALEHAPDESFATVDDALPFDGPTMDAQPAISASSFAPPPIEPVEAAPPAPVAVASDEHQFFGGNTFDFDTPKSDDDRKTAEVPPEMLAHADEVERKTDEFELIELDGATLQEPAVGPMEGKTAEVPKVSIFKKLFSRTKEVTQVEPAVAPPPSANPTFLVQKFRTFYNEVVVYKNQKAELTAGFATAIVTSYDADLSPEQAANSLSLRLQQMLELQLAESSWMGGEIQEQYPNAQYAMACLADEMLANMEWPGQPAWGKHRLELTVFKTVASDLEVFKRVDKLLKNGPQTVGTRDLARVYLLTVASGFKGKYRPFDLPRALAEYRRRLYEFVYGGDALLLYAEERRIFPEAVSVTVVGKGVKRFSLAQQWAAILVLLLASYTFISHMAWKKVSADLKDIAGRVEQAKNPAPPENPNGGGGR